MNLDFAFIEGKLMIIPLYFFPNIDWDRLDDGSSQK